MAEGIRVVRIKRRSRALTHFVQPSSFQAQDAVETAFEFGGVGDEEDGAPLGGRAQGDEEGSFSLFVQALCRLVEEQDRCGLQQRTGQRQPASLAAGKIDACLANPTLQPVRQVGHEVRESGVAQGLPELCLFGIGLADQEVLPDGAGKIGVSCDSTAMRAWMSA